MQEDQQTLSKRVFETAQRYLADFKTAVDHVKASNNLIETTLNPVGNTMKSDLVAVYNMVVKESDSLGQKVLSQSSGVARTIVIVAVLALILAATAGFFISCAITVQISQDIADVSVSMNEMSTSSSQVNLSAQELSKLSESLKQMVDQFKGLTN